MNSRYNFNVYKKTPTEDNRYSAEQIVSVDVDLPTNKFWDLVASIVGAQLDEAEAQNNPESEVVLRPIHVGQKIISNPLTYAWAMINLSGEELLDFIQNGGRFKE